MGTDVLGCKGRKAVGKGGHTGDREGIQLDGGRISRNDSGAEAVNQTLDEQVPNGNEALLQNAGCGKRTDGLRWSGVFADGKTV